MLAIGYSARLNAIYSIIVQDFFPNSPPRGRMDLVISGNMNKIISNLRIYEELYKSYEYKTGLYFPYAVDSSEHLLTMHSIDKEFYSSFIFDELPGDDKRESRFFDCSLDFSWTDEIDVIIPVHTFGNGAACDRGLRRKIRDKGKRIAINDLVSANARINENEKKCEIVFRERLFCVHYGTVIPSHYANDPFIDHVMATYTGSPTRILDLCTGSGCVGISLALEFPGVEEVRLFDISRYAMQSAEENIGRLLPASGMDAKAILSNGFSAIDKSKKFDLIVANPPNHGGGKVNRVQDLAGTDPMCQFHRDFFRNLHLHLTEDGTAFMVENARSSCIKPDELLEMAAELSPVELDMTFEHACGTEFYFCQVRLS